MENGPEVDLGCSSDEHAHVTHSLIPGLSRRIITATAWRAVTRSVNIDEPLPNALFTLAPPVIHTCIAAANVDPAVFFLCQKLFRVEQTFQDEKEVYEDISTVMTLSNGRLFAMGDNLWGQCGVGDTAARLATFHWIRLPPVRTIWGGFGRWVADTSRGAYRWGRTTCMDRNRVTFATTRSPMHIPVGTVTNAAITENNTFVRTTRGWHMVGATADHLIDAKAPHTDGPAFIPDSSDITRIAATKDHIYAWTDGDLLSAGDNYSGQCGRPGNETLRLGPVRLPDGLTARDVANIKFGDRATFLITWQGACYVCGNTKFGQLGIGGEGSDESGRLDVLTKVALPHVSDVISCSGVTVFQTESGPFVAGINDYRLWPINRRLIPTPLPLTLPGTPRTLSIGYRTVFVELTEGEWVARGWNEHGKLGIGELDWVIREWRPVLLEGITAIIEGQESIRAVFFATDKGIYGAGDNQPDRYGGILGVTVDGVTEDGQTADAEVHTPMAIRRTPNNYRNGAVQMQQLFLD